MLQFDDVKFVCNNKVIAYGDDKRPEVYYILPDAPTYRTNELGVPAFHLVKYKQLREEGGDKFGGLIAFDTCLAVSPDLQNQAKQELQVYVDQKFHGRTAPPVQIGPLSWTSGTVELIIGQGDGAGGPGLIADRVQCAGVPSLYGDNVATFWAELSQMGSTILWETMQGQGSGFVAVVYKVKVWAKMPPLRGTANWHASSFYSFFQEVDIEDNFWSEDSYTETIRDSMQNREWQQIHIDRISIPGLPADKVDKINDDVYNIVQSQLEKAVARNVLQAIQAVNPDVKSLWDDQDIENIKRDVSSSRVSDVNIDVTQTLTVEWALNPQGSLPTITSMKGPDGKPLKWESFAQEVNLDDPFFRVLEVTLNVNADFDDLPIFNVEAKITYPYGDGVVKEFVFANANDVGKFRCFIENNKRDYKVTYTVNYKGRAESFSPPEMEKDDTHLTINIDDLGIWAVDIEAQDMNFEQVSQAIVTVRLEDAVPHIERQVTLTKDALKHKIREVTLRANAGTYKYHFKYIMADGKEIDGGWKDHDAKQLYVADPFADTKVILLQAAGDLENRIDNILLEVEYKDQANGYSQRKTVTLSKDLNNDTWTFPVINPDAGAVTYQATIHYKDGSTREVPATPSDRGSITVGDVFEDKLTIKIVPSLIDWGVVKLANVSMRYSDPANDFTKSEDILFQDGTAPTNWTVELKNKSKIDYDWTAQFYLANGEERGVTVAGSVNKTIILKLPDAPPA